MCRRVCAPVQIGKAFRNEITPRNFIFRSREFEQMEVRVKYIYNCCTTVGVEVMGQLQG
jgi:hypothetical protein